MKLTMEQDNEIINMNKQFSEMINRMITRGVSMEYLSAMRQNFLDDLALFSAKCRIENDKK